jgi:protein TonB
MKHLVLLLFAVSLMPADEITRPEVVRKVEPDYTDEAKESGIEGRIVLRVMIASDGNPSDIAVVRPLGYGLDEKAVEALRQWVFRPATKDGKPVDFEASVEMNFRLL